MSTSASEPAPPVQLNVLPCEMRRFFMSKAYFSDSEPVYQGLHIGEEHSVFNWGELNRGIQSAYHLFANQDLIPKICNEIHLGIICGNGICMK